MNPSRFPTIEMPDVLGKTKRQAMAQFLAVGIRVDTAVVYVEDMAEDVVRGVIFNGKELKGGDKIQQSSMVKLKIGDGKLGELNDDEFGLEVETDGDIQF